MRPLTLHPASLIAGVLFAGLAFVSMSQTPVLNARTVNVQYLPDPRDMVQVYGGVPFTVPAGKIFVLTALGSTGWGSYQPVLRVNGVNQMLASGSPDCVSPASMTAMPPGFTAAAGSLIEIVDYQGGPFQGYRAWGYLAPQ